LGDSTIYAQIEIEFVLKRGTRCYRAGRIALLYDQTDTAVRVGYSEIVTDPDFDDLGVTFIGSISSGTMQLGITVDGSEANSAILNYKIVSKKPITVA
jgi:hypothetical protein